MNLSIDESRIEVTRHRLRQREVENTNQNISLPGTQCLLTMQIEANVSRKLLLDSEWVITRLYQCLEGSGLILTTSGEIYVVNDSTCTPQLKCKKFNCV